MKNRKERLQHKINLQVSRIKFGSESEQREAFRRYESYCVKYKKLTGEEYRPI